MLGFQVEEEYEVVDTYDLVASVGGSLGLFLGFSVLDCLLLLDCRALKQWWDSFPGLNKTKHKIKEEETLTKLKDLTNSTQK